jgi:hypothetical protein
MGTQFLYGDRVKVLPGTGYDKLDGLVGTIKGLAMNIVITGQIFIVDFDAIVDDEFPWSSCCIPESLLERIL